MFPNAYINLEESANWLMEFLIVVSHYILVSRAHNVFVLIQIK